MRVTRTTTNGEVCTETYTDREADGRPPTPDAPRGARQAKRPEQSGKSLRTAGTYTGSATGARRG